MIYTHVHAHTRKCKSRVCMWEKMWYLFFLFWLISLSIMSSKSIHFPANIKILFFIANKILCHIFFVHSSVDRFLGWFHFLAIVKNEVMNIDIQIAVLFLILEEPPLQLPQWLPTLYRVPFSPCPHRHFLSFIFLKATLTGWNWFSKKF